MRGRVATTARLAEGSGPRGGSCHACSRGRETNRRHPGGGSGMARTGGRPTLAAVSSRGAEWSASAMEDEEPGRPLRPPRRSSGAASHLVGWSVASPRRPGPAARPAHLLADHAGRGRRPHTTGLGAEWLDGSWWFETGRSTRKGRNLERDPRCTLAVALDEFDLVVSGHRLGGDRPGDGGPAGRDLGRRRLAVPGRRVGTALTAEFSAPSAGKPPWHVYRITAGLGDGAVHGRARRSDPVRLLSSALEPARRGWAGRGSSSETPELRSAWVSPSTLSENGSQS